MWLRICMIYQQAVTYAHICTCTEMQICTHLHTHTHLSSFVEQTNDERELKRESAVCGKGQTDRESMWDGQLESQRNQSVQEKQEFEGKKQFHLQVARQRMQMQSPHAHIFTYTFTSMCSCLTQSFPAMKPPQL